MNSFNVKTIQDLIKLSLEENPTGDDWLDSRYTEQIHWIGHTNPYYKLFYHLSHSLKPNLVVELGSWQATGAAHFASGNPEGQVITIDIHKDDKNAQIRTIEAASHYPNLTYLNRWTWDAIDFVKGLETKIDILFIDAWHDYQYAKKEWDLYSLLLADNALIIADDITAAFNFEGMLKFWDELPEPKFLDTDLHRGIPMGFVIKEQENVGQDKPTDTSESTTAGKRGRPRKKS